MRLSCSPFACRDLALRRVESDVTILRCSSVTSSSDVKWRCTCQVVQTRSIHLVQGFEIHLLCWKARTHPCVQLYLVHSEHDRLSAASYLFTGKGCQKQVVTEILVFQQLPGILVDDLGIPLCEPLLPGISFHGPSFLIPLLSQ